MINGGGDVDSVFGRKGSVSAQASDYDASQVDNDSGVAGATVKDALDNLSGGTAPVTSVFSRIGAVVATASDYNASQIDNDSGVTGATVKDALDTLNGTTGPTTPGTTVDKGRTVWSGIAGNALEDVGLRDYGASATDPTTPTPADGDAYWNTTLKMQMYYDGSRSKWLSVNTSEIAFGRNGNTGPGAYYRGPANRAYSGTNGRHADHDGTVVAMTYTRNDTDAATFEVMADGVSISTLPSAATGGSDSTLDDDFNSGQVLGVRNQGGGNATSQVMGWVTIRWRA